MLMRDVVLGFVKGTSCVFAIRLSKCLSNPLSIPSLQGPRFNISRLRYMDF